MKALILADVHANYPALSAVLDSAEAMDAVYCLGDIVLFGPEPVACIDLLRSRSIPVVRGNHDAELARFCRQGADRQPCRTDGERWKQWTADQLRDDQIDYLASLPEEISLTLDGRRVLLRHDLPVPGPLIMPEATDELIESRMGPGTFEYLFVGHVHIPYLRALGRRHLVDVGSVGQPEHRDGRCSYAVWDNGRVVFHKVEYDVKRAVADLEKLPLSHPYIALWSAFWRNGFVDREALAALEAST